MCLYISVLITEGNLRLTLQAGIDNNTNNKRDKDMLHNQTVFNLDYIKRGRYKKSLYQNNKRSNGLS